MRVVKSVVAIACLLLSAGAAAGTATLNWTNPTTYTDGTPMPLSDLSSITLQYGQCPDGKTMPATVSTVSVPESATTPVTTYTVTGLANSPATGTPVIYCFQANAVSPTHGASAWTNPVSKQMPPPAPPSAPSGLSVTAVTAYTFEKQPDRLAFLAVGTVTPGTQCDASQPVGPYFVVPRAAVTWYGTVQPPLVVAQC